jgi:hypothetical protein
MKEAFMGPSDADKGWENWTKTVDDGITNKAWDEYDELIKTETADYNKRLAGTTRFVLIDWKIFKAMVWAESGGPSNPAWKTRPMQIGHQKDPGYAALKNQEGAAQVVMSAKLKEDIKGDIKKPVLNIRAGIAYALSRLAEFKDMSVYDPKDATVREYTVVPGDNLYDIATKKVESTEAAMKELNPTAKVLQPGQKLKCRKASIKRIITGWRAITPSNLYTYYNKGDLRYAQKLTYVLALFPRLKR